MSENPNENVMNPISEDIPKESFAQLIEDKIELVGADKKSSKYWLELLAYEKHTRNPEECYIPISSFINILYKTYLGGEEGFDYEQIIQLRNYVQPGESYIKLAVWNILCHLSEKVQKLTKEQSNEVCDWIENSVPNSFSFTPTKVDYKKIFGIMCDLNTEQAKKIFELCGDSFDEKYIIKRLVDNGSWDLDTYRAFMDSLADRSASAKFLTGIFQMLKDNKTVSGRYGIKKFADADLDRLLAKVNSPNTFPGSSISSYIFYHYTGKTYDGKKDIEIYDNASQFSKDKLLEFFVKGCAPRSVELEDFCGAGLEFCDVEQEYFSRAVLGIKEISSEDELKFVVRGKTVAGKVKKYRDDLKTEDLYSLSQRLDFSFVDKRGSEDAFKLFLKPLITSVASHQSLGPDCVSGAIMTLLYFVHGERYKFNDLLALFTDNGFRAEYFNRNLNDKALYTFLAHCYVRPNSSEFRKGILSDKDIIMLHDWLMPGAQLSIKTAVLLTRRSIDFCKLDKAREEERKRTGKVARLTAAETLRRMGWDSCDGSLGSLEGERESEEFFRELVAAITGHCEEPRPLMEDDEFGHCFLC